MGIIKSKECLHLWKSGAGHEKKYLDYDSFEKAYLAGEITATEPTLPGTSGPTPEQAAAMVEVARLKKELADDPEARERSFWNDNPAIREEFLSFENFLAFHENRDRIKIAGNSSK
jgi:hypothetical protein